MNDTEQEKIILYTSRWCAHSVTIERYLSRHDVEVKKVSIDGNQDARSDLMEINSGYASVPTLIFPDGSKLTEPSFGEISKKLGFEKSSGLMGRVRAILGGENKDSKIP